MNLQIIFLGAPGSGKGTQASSMVKKLNFTHLSTGNILRREIELGTSLGQSIRETLDGGRLVDNGVILELLKSHFDPHCGRRYIFDGIPRNLRQAKDLDEFILKDAPSKALYFHIDLEQLVERIVNRRVCPSCGSIFNLLSRAPVREGICDGCGAELVKRSDDTEGIIGERMAIFKEEIQPILGYYGDRGRLEKLDASRGDAEVFGRIEKILEQ